jgi:hypothetical protein
MSFIQRRRDMTRVIFFAAVATATLLIAGCDTDPNWHRNTGVHSSDPQLHGARDMNYDHMIVAGSRIGPVGMGAAVGDVVQHLGTPDTVNRSTFRGPGYAADEVYYYYNDECISFTWQDSGISPQVESGLRGINVTCDKWSTADGIHVGSMMSDLDAHLSSYCPFNRQDGTLLIETKNGIWFFAKDRNSPINQISVIPTMNTWDCKD